MVDKIYCLGAEHHLEFISANPSIPDISFIDQQKQQNKNFLIFISLQKTQIGLPGEV